MIYKTKQERAEEARRIFSNSEFKEEDHPRGDDGKFGKGGGGASEKIKKNIEDISKKVKFQDGKQASNAKEMVSVLNDLGIKAKYNDDYTTAPLQMRHGEEEIQINGGCDFWRNPKKMFKKIKEGDYSSSEWTHVIAHEMAHIGNTFEPKKREFEKEEEKKIANKVSRYSTDNKNEFIAEYIAGGISGKIYDDEVNSLYNKYMRELSTKSNSSPVKVYRAPK